MLHHLLDTPLTKLGRFYSVRKTYSFFQYQYQTWQNRPPLDHPPINDETQFPDFDIETCTHELRSIGVSFGLTLPEPLLQEVYHYAVATPCQEPGYEAPFWQPQVMQGHLPDGHRVLRGLVHQPDRCSAIQQLMHDRVLLQIVQQYLGYYPTQIQPCLTWSFATDLSLTDLQSLYPPTNYHYDIAGFNFMTVYFYITSVDRQTGPHVMIPRSHQHKPLRMVLTSGRCGNQRVLDHYGEENQMWITGAAGFGFVQDPSCFHKVVSPVAGDRLLLQLRYA